MSFALYRFTMFFACFVFPLCRFLNHQLTCLNLGGDLGLGVGDLDAQLLGAGNDVDALAGGDSRGNLGGVGAVVHHEELEVLDVVDQEGLVAGGHHVAGLLVGAVADLGGVFVRERSPRGRNPARQERTEGMAMLPRKRRRTRLSIPLGFLQLGSRHLKRSDWWRKKREVPVHRVNIGLERACAPAWHRGT